MKHRTALALALGFLVAGAASLARGGVIGSAEDDLAIVKKAVASPPPAARAVRSAPRRDEVVAVAQVAPAPVAPAPVAEAIPVVRSGGEPKWFKVRVVERGTGRKKVTVNLPLSLVRALGDDTIDWGCRGDADGRRHCHGVRLSDVLRSLEAGQELVEVEDENAVVKVWVE
jgi:hypothetical protein